MLISKNVTVNGRRTSMRLEPAMWAALADVARRENRTIGEVCSEIDCNRGPADTLTRAVRIYIVGFYRSTVEGWEGSAGTRP